MRAGQRESWWQVVRGLALALLLAVLLLHVAMPRVRVSPGDRLTPNAPARQPGPSARPSGPKAAPETLLDGGAPEGKATRATNPAD